jgi:hypothetical protein
MTSPCPPRQTLLNQGAVWQKPMQFWQFVLCIAGKIRHNYAINSTRMALGALWQHWTRFLKYAICTKPMVI